MIEAVPGSPTRELVELTHLVDGSGEALEGLLKRGLEWLARLAPYELAVVFELQGERLLPRAMRGPLSGPEIRNHALFLAAFPSIAAAIEERRARVFTEDDHAHGEGDPFDNVLDLPHGHACMVVPLVAGTDVYGVMTLDRRECVRYPDSVVNLVEIYGRLLTMTIQLSRQAERLAQHNVAAEERLAALDRRLTAAAEEAGILATSRSAPVRELSRRAELVAETTTPVLLTGETGTGKERLARAIHAMSARRDRPFVPVNCAAIPAGLLESELFGHERGAFTGATRARAGLFRSAEGGTLLLDEVGELPGELQAKLLRVLQFGEISPVGSDQARKVDVRIIAATHVGLEAAVGEKRFREDLYYRLSVFPLHLVPLRERLEDLPELCARLLDEVSVRTGRHGLRVSPPGLAALGRCAFPGNIRELSNLFERAAITASGTVLGPRELGLHEPAQRSASPAPELRSSPEQATELVTLAEQERRHIARVLEATGRRIYGPGGAAEILGVPPSTLQSRMRKLGLSRARGA